jgi:hypothetical protein
MLATWSLESCEHLTCKGFSLPIRATQSRSYLRNTNDFELPTVWSDTKDLLSVVTDLWERCTEGWVIESRFIVKKIPSDGNVVWDSEHVDCNHWGLETRNNVLKRSNLRSTSVGTNFLSGQKPPFRDQASSAVARGPLDKRIINSRWWRCT